MTAAFASRSSSRTWGALCEDRSVTFDINASILAIRFRTFFDFMTTPVHVHSAELDRRPTHGGDEFDLGIQPIPAVTQISKCLCSGPVSGPGRVPMAYCSSDCSDGCCKISTVAYFSGEWIVATLSVIRL